MIHVSGVADYKNKAYISVSKSKGVGEEYYGYKIEDVSEGLVRMDISMGYNFFQYLGPNKTRHVAIWNTDPKIDYMPTFLMNYMMINVLNANMTGLQEFAKRLENKDESQDIYHFYERKQPYYDHVLECLLDPVYLKKNTYFRVKDCPDHPANPNSPNHDPNDPDNWQPQQ